MTNTSFGFHKQKQQPSAKGQISMEDIVKEREAEGDERRNRERGG
jgi:hypothetical protein